MSSFVFRTRTANRLRILLFTVIALAAAATVESKVYLELTKTGGRKVVIAVTPFERNESEEVSALRTILEDDLRRSGYFELLPIESLQRDLYEIESDTNKVNFPSWTSWGSELLLRVSYRKRGRVIIQSKLYDANKGSLMLGRQYKAQPQNVIRAVHTLADDVVKNITGEKGIALSRIAFTRADGGDKRISIMDYDGRDIRPVSQPGVLALYPEWFPDGRRLAYVSYRRGRTEVVIHDLQDGRVKSLAFFPGMNAFPSVSPDGRQVLLTLSRDGNPEIYRIRADGSSLKRLTFSKAVEASPVWSPDQRRIAFVSDRAGSPQIYISNVNGGRAKRISFTGSYSSSPDWSPRGSQIVFTSLAGGFFQIFLYDLESGETTQLTSGWGNKEDPAWASNGRHIIFSQGKKASYRLVMLNTQTGEIFELPRPAGSHTSPAWSP